MAGVVDMLCEGEIEGIVGLNVSKEMAERNIFFDGVPMRNASGTPNFSLDGLDWHFVSGTQSQDVLPVGANVTSEIQVGQEVKHGNTGGGPVTRNIPENYIDACRVTILVPRLTLQNVTNGDINGTSVTIAIDVQANGGGYVEVMQRTISGKTNSEYQVSYEFDLPGTGPWDIRVRRITPDATSSAVADQTIWSTFTKIVRQKLSYPNTAMIGLRVDSEIFSKVPARGYRLKLLKVKVPTNYNPLTRVYSGLWNGTFKLAWTDNPAWCWYDLATSTRYGLGDYLGADSIDKWALYSIAQYCDTLVPNGFGGTEPRFTCNLLLQTREEAIKVLMNMASIFRGIVYWHTNTIYCSQDRPGDAVKLFNPSNVIDGLFNYSGTARQARHTVAMVSWNDPENMYQQTVEYVEDREGILRLGVREIEITAMGCTSRGQANRLGRWTLLTEREETDTITFKTGIEGCGVMPGEIIKTTDPSRAGDRVGGRIVAATSTTVTLDAPVTLKAGVNYTLAVLLPSGAIDDVAVSSGGPEDTTLSTLTVGTAFAQTPMANAVWILAAAALEPELWRVMATVEVEPGIVEITALEHVPGKYAAIEQNLKLEPRNTTNLRLVPKAVTNLNALTDIKRLNDLQYTTRILVSWTSDDAVRFAVAWRRGNDNYTTVYVNEPSIDIDNVAAGTFEISITPENAIGLSGPQTSITYVVDESHVEGDVQNLVVNPAFNSKDCTITWTRYPGATSYKVRVSVGLTTLREETIQDNAYTYSFSKNLQDGGPRRSFTVQVKAVTWRGESANWASVLAENPPPGMPQGVQLEPGPGQVSVMAIRPLDDDLAGMVVWMSSDPTVPQTSGNIIYTGTDNAYMKTGLQAGIPMYFRVAFYDAFGTTGLNVSSSVMAIPTATGGILVVTELPLDLSDVAGELAVFLDVPDTEERGLYGWDGTQWISTAKILDGSITTNKLGEGAVDFTKLALGAVQARNLSIRKHFLF